MSHPVLTQCYFVPVMHWAAHQGNWTKTRRRSVKMTRRRRRTLGRKEQEEEKEKEEGVVE